MSFYIRNVETGLVLDVQSSEKRNGTHIIMWPFHGGDNQLWEYKNNMIISKASGLVLDIYKNQHAAPIITYESHGGPNQKWHFDDDFTIRSESEMVLDVQNGAVDQGTPVIGYKKHCGVNQKFQVVPYDKLALDISGGSHGAPIITYNSHGGHNQKWFFDDDFTIRSGTGMVMDIEGGQGYQGARVISYNKHGGPNQKFRIVPHDK
ncbi:hypothetical protein C0J52_19718 [Blattella germanica]|nr:hypothetical protein C0J52_19718 [Blattella germanica]